MLKRFILTAALVAGMFSLSFAQENNTKKFAGIWKGALDMQGQSITVIFTFIEKDGKLTGTGESPEQGGGTIALDNIAVAGNKIQFDITAVRAGYDGTFNEAKKIIEGTLVMGEQGMPLNLAKDENAKVPEEKKFTSVWEGVLAVPNASFRVIIKIYTNADGTLGGVLDSPDQNATISITEVTLTDELLKFVVPTGSSTYSGKIDKATMTAKGIFSQGGQEIPLELKKADNPVQK